MIKYLKHPFAIALLSFLIGFFCYDKAYRQAYAQAFKDAKIQQAKAYEQAQTFKKTYKAYAQARIALKKADQALKKTKKKYQSKNFWIGFSKEFQAYHKARIAKLKADEALNQAYTQAHEIPPPNYG